MNRKKGTKTGYFVSANNVNLNQIDLVLSLGIFYHKSN